MGRVWSTKTPSMLRKCTVKAMKKFNWEDLVTELKDTSPTFCQVLQGVFRRRRKASKRRKSYAISESAVVGMCVAILLRHHNVNMNLVQRIVSALLYSGHAP